MNRLLLSASATVALAFASAGVGYAQTSPATHSQTPATSEPSQSSTEQPQGSQGQMQLSKSQAEQVQKELKSAGLYKGPIDGEVGPKMKQAISQFQQQNGLNQTGVVDQQTFAALSNNNNNQGSKNQNEGTALTPNTTR
jgi:peptidoglycan hydrolase-like protein with peptidoglycan-binding domain